MDFRCLSLTLTTTASLQLDLQQPWQVINDVLGPAELCSTGYFPRPLLIGIIIREQG